MLAVKEPLRIRVWDSFGPQAASGKLNGALWPLQGLHLWDVVEVLSSTENVVPFGV